MSVFKSMDKMMKNQAVLYGVLFITVTNVFGYLMVRNYEAIVFFALVAYLSSEFTKNNVLVCLVALLMTNILLAIVQGRKVYEGMREGPQDDTADEIAIPPKPPRESPGAGHPKSGGPKPGGPKPGGPKPKPPQVNQKATTMAATEGMVPNLSDSKMNEHMANLDRIEGLLNKQEGLVGSLSKIENMMGKLESMGAKRIDRRQD